MSEILRALSGSRLFAGLPEEDCTRLAGWMRIRGVEAGETLVVEGEPAGALFVVCQGTLLVSKDLGRASEALVSRLEAGDHAGELDLIDAGRASASVVSEGPAIVAVLDQRRLRQMLVTDRRLFSHVSRALFVDLAQKVRSTNDKVRDAIQWGLDAMGQTEG
jgi:CRP-like cAMP-binding protein